MLRAHVTNPSPSDLRAFLHTHLAQPDCVVQLAGECEITYHGRTASTADAGNYFIVVKCDGSVQIHGARGIKPVNWQPKTDELTATVHGEYCVLTATRKSPLETVRVTFLRADVAQVLELPEVAFTLTGSEKDMQDAVKRSPELIEPGLRVLDLELPEASGDFDVYARDAQGRFVVIELKRARATQEAVYQLDRYVQTVRLRNIGEVRGILAAPAITHPALLELERLQLEFVEVRALPEVKERAQPSLF